MNAFIALDVETAEPELYSICQIGMIKYENGETSDKINTYIDPQIETYDLEDNIVDEYTNTWLHDIRPSTVEGSPTFSEFYPKLIEFCENNIVAHHTHFDRSSIRSAIEVDGCSPLACTWLDTAKVVRRTWPQFENKGYGLGPVTEHLGIDFKHHDAIEDARACGEILLAAMSEKSFNLDEWLKRISQPIHAPKSKDDYEPNPDGVLWGNNIVFTGDLSLSRNDAKQLAANAGCVIQDNVNKHTTILVIGIQDKRKLRGNEKSSKQRKAEKWINKGKNIRLMTESDFMGSISVDV